MISNDFFPQFFTIVPFSAHSNLGAFLGIWNLTFVTWRVVTLRAQRRRRERLTSLGCHKVRTVCHFVDNILLGDEGTIQCVRKYNRENRGQEIGIYE